MTILTKNHSRTHARTLLLMAALLFVLASPGAQAAPKADSISLIPTVTRFTLQDGNLFAAGFVTATIKGKTTAASFSGAPVGVSLAGGQSSDPDPCPILDLSLGPISLNLLGLVVETSPICLEITAYHGGGTLGDLLCTVARLLDGGLNLNQVLSGRDLVDPSTGDVILHGLTTAQLISLHEGLVDLLNAALQKLYGAALAAVDNVDAGGTCAILHLRLGPVNLTLLGLDVRLDNCDGGPVGVNVTAVTGRGNLLGNLLCDRLHHGHRVRQGMTLQEILQLIMHKPDDDSD